MRKIAVLDQQTIDKIAAGEVVERPSSIVKELVENAIDAGATAVTVEITDGGKKMIRITDNGGGMERDQVPLAFLRHATSKIEKVEDLEHIASLGFRGDLDVALVLHAEHGGGNNSTFTTHVVTSSGTDTYSTIAASIASLKGPKHGGANLKVQRMFADIMEHCSDWENKDEICEYLLKILDKQAFDHAGLIYGMGHAVYTLSDPRAVILKKFAKSLSEEKGMQKEFALYELVEREAGNLIMQKRQVFKPVCANVDFYSGFVYSMLDLPLELYTPIFAVARIVGWSAHRMEELINTDKIIRPAYKNVLAPAVYVPLKERE